MSARGGVAGCPKCGERGMTIGELLRHSCPGNRCCIVQGVDGFGVRAAVTGTLLVHGLATRAEAEEHMARFNAAADGHVAAERLRRLGVRTHLVLRLDVTDLSGEEIDALSGELHAMAEAGDDHGSAEVVALDLEVAG